VRGEVLAVLLVSVVGDSGEELVDWPFCCDFCRWLLVSIRFD